MTIGTQALYRTTEYFLLYLDKGLLEEALLFKKIKRTIEASYVAAMALFFFI